MRSLSRRSILGGAAALPVITAAPAFAAFGVDRSEWTAALAQLLAAEAAADRADEAFSRAFDAAEAEMPARPPLNFDVPCDDLHGVDALTAFPVRFSSEQQMRDPCRFESRGMQYFHEKAQAALIPQWDAYNQKRAVIRQRHNMDALADEAERAGNAACRAHNRLMETPAPDAAALAIKLERLWGNTLDWGDPSDEHKRAVIADARRLAGKEAPNA